MTLTRRIARLEARTRRPDLEARVRIVILEDGEEAPAAQEGERLIVIAPWGPSEVRVEDFGDA